MIKSDILFTGFYGQLNTGDDAFVEVSSWASKNIWHKNRIRFLGLKSKMPFTQVPYDAYLVRFPRSYKKQDDLLLNHTKALISSGGSTIHSELKPDSIKYKALKRKETNKDFKVGAVGVSIGPFKSVKDENAVKKYLQSIDFLALRDKRSFDFANALQLSYKPVEAFDMAALLPQIYHYKKEETKTENPQITIGVSVCHHESIHKDLDVKNELHRQKQTESLLRLLSKNPNIHFKFFIFNGNPVIGDKAITLQTIKNAELANYSIIEYTRDTKQMFYHIANCDFVISTRLHAGIFACFAQTPFMQIEYHQKCADFLIDMGIDEEMRIYDIEGDTKVIADKIEKIISGDTPYKIPQNFKENQEKALKNFTEVKF